MFKEFNYVLAISIWSLELWERKKMCEARKWNKLYCGEIIHIEKLEANYHFTNLFGERSDGKIFSISIYIDNINNTLEIAHVIRNAINELESYRTCNCLTGETCFKHVIDKIKSDEHEVFVGTAFPDITFNFEKETK